MAGSITALVSVAVLLGATVLDDSCFLIFAASLAAFALFGLMGTRLLAATDPLRRGDAGRAPKGPTR